MLLFGLFPEAQNPAFQMAGLNAICLQIHHSQFAFLAHLADHQISVLWVQMVVSLLHGTEVQRDAFNVFKIQPHRFGFTVQFITQIKDALEGLFSHGLCSVTHGLFCRISFVMLSAMIEDVSPQEGLARVQAGALLIDVREPGEYQEVHAEGAQLIPLSEFEARYTEIPQDRELVMICRSGARSARAGSYLLQNGYSNVVNLAGGTMAWVNEGLPHVKGE